MLVQFLQVVGPSGRDCASDEVTHTHLGVAHLVQVLHCVLKVQDAEFSETGDFLLREILLQDL